MTSSIRRRLVTGFLLLVVIVLGGASGYFAIGGGRWAFGDCLYMTVITVTTVGYGEILPGMADVEGARAFTMTILLFGTGGLVYFASVVTAFVVEGDLKNVLFQRQLDRRIKRMRDHVVVCGAGTTGRNAISELLKNGARVIAIDTDEVELRDIAKTASTNSFAYLVGDATDDDVLNKANLAAARGAVLALTSDKDNLYLAVGARQTNPDIRIIARCAELSHVEKLKRAGANAVVSPSHIGGLRLVSELLRPSVVRFLDDVMRDKANAPRIEEITLEESTPALGTTLREARIRERFGMTVLAVRSNSSTSWSYNPDASHAIEAGMTIVVFGSETQIRSFRREISAIKG